MFFIWLFFPDTIMLLPIALMTKAYNKKTQFEINPTCPRCKIRITDANPVDDTTVAKCVRVLLTVDEVALFLPNEKGIAQSREDEASQDLAGTGVST